MEDFMVSFVVFWLIINVSKVGFENFVNFWNYYCILGEWWYLKSYVFLSFIEIIGNYSNIVLLFI